MWDAQEMIIQYKDWESACSTIPPSAASEKSLFKKKKNNCPIEMNGQKTNIFV